jgi:hypothetical protein
LDISIAKVKAALRAALQIYGLLWTAARNAAFTFAAMHD